MHKKQEEVKMRVKKGFALLVLWVLVSVFVVNFRVADVRAADKPKEVVLAVQHFSPGAGASWCGSCHAACPWLVHKYPWLTYI